MDSLPPETGPQSSSRSPISAPPVLTRTYPKPPPLFQRMALLSLKPEAWAAAALYPFWVTLLPLILAIVITACAAAVATPLRLIRALDAFSHTLESRHVDLLLNSDGILSTATPLTAPLTFMFGDQHILIDPSGKTSFDSIKDDWAALVTNQMIYHRDRGGDFDPLAIKDMAPLTLPEKGGITHINSDVLRPFLVDQRPTLIFSFAVIGFLVKLLTESLWVAATMFFIFHTVRIGASLGAVRLALPKRVACRIAAAVLVPVVLFSGLTNASGYSLTALIGSRASLITWFFAASALALWAGHLAKTLFTPKPVRHRAT